MIRYFQEKSAKTFFILLVLIQVCLLSNVVQATHIKAGEITARLVGQFEAEFKLVLYMKTESLNQGLIDAQKSATFNFTAAIADVTVLNPIIVDIDATTRQYTYVGRVFFPPGVNNFTISYYNENRNADIKNIDQSVAISMYLETKINTTESFNTLPVLSIPPIDIAAVGVVFTHNPGAKDLDGDSISYALVSPKQRGGGPVISYPPETRPTGGSAVNGGAAYSRVDPITGDFIWDTPTVEGLYNVAIEIKEWRKLPSGRYINLSTILRDMQVEVKENLNRRPEIVVNPDTCVIASVNSLIEIPIKVYDPDSIRPRNYQNVFLNAYNLPAGANLILNKPNANFSLPNPGSALIQWTAGCKDVSNQPYFINLQAKDEVVQSRQLVTYKTTKIKVNGAKPTNLAISRIQKGFILNWDQYPCSNTDSILIYRNDCDTNNYVAQSCEITVPSNFIKIGSVASNATTYFDTTKIVQGSQYNYVIKARFTGIQQGMSLYSDAVSVNTFYYEPLLTNITVVRTAESEGIIQINWLKPKTEDNSTIKYQLQRKQNVANSTFETVYTSTNINDTTYTDSLGLNTAKDQYIYQLQFIKNNQSPSITTSSSSVFVKGTPQNKSISLNWQSNTAWDNTLYSHFIYRKRISDTIFVKFDSVLVTSLEGSYTNTGLVKTDTMCYYIATRGKYCSDSIPSPLINLSQQVCLAPSDSTKPCVPRLALEDENCNLSATELNARPFKNNLSWIFDNSQDSTCNTDILGFKLYKAADEKSDYKFLTQVAPDARTYIDLDDISQAGCYQITAVSTIGVESDRSNIECNDNCSFYALPNLIIPNGNLENQKFNPLKTPYGVKMVKLSIYNRWGDMVHYQESGPMLNWNPYEKNKDFSDGVYYYYAQIIYERKQNPKNNTSSLKGWVHILSNNPSK